MPALTQIEEVNTHEDITQTHPQLNLVFRKQPTDDRKQYSQVCHIRNLLHEMHNNLHTEEREKKPHGRVAIEMALQPNVTPRELIPIPMQLIREKEKYTKI